MAITAGESAASRMGSWSHGFGRALRTTIRFGPGKCLADSSGIRFGFPTQPKYGVVMRSKKPSREKMMWNFRPQMAQYSSLCTSTIRYLKELTLTKSLVGPGSNTWVKHLERGGGCHGSSRKRSRHAIFEASSVGNPTGYGDSMSWHCMEHHDDMMGTSCNEISIAFLISSSLPPMTRGNLKRFCHGRHSCCCCHRSSQLGHNQPTSGRHTGCRLHSAVAIRFHCY